MTDQALLDLGPRPGDAPGDAPGDPDPILPEPGIPGDLPDPDLPGDVPGDVPSDLPGDLPDPGLPLSGLHPAARRALAEAEARRRAAGDLRLPPERGGRDGPEPVRFGDWELKGLAVDF